MSIQSISKEILQKAESEKENYNIKLKEEEDRLEKEMLERVENEKKKIYAKHESELKNTKEKIIGGYKKESKTIVLETKEEIIKNVYENALEKIKSLDKKETEKILEKLLNIAKQYLEYDTIHVSKQHEKFIRSIKEDRKIKVIVEDKLNGLIFTANNNKLKIDLTFETILRDTFENNKEKFLKILFKSK